MSGVLRGERWGAPPDSWADRALSALLRPKQPLPRTQAVTLEHPPAREGYRGGRAHAPPARLGHRRSERPGRERARSRRAPAKARLPPDPRPVPRRPAAANHRPPVTQRQ